MEVILLDRVEVVLAVAAGLNHLGHAEQGEVVADSWLALAQTLAQGGDVQFTFPHQEHEDLEAGLIGQQLEDLDEVLFQLLGQVSCGGSWSGGDLWGFQQFSGHLIVFREWWCRTSEVIPTFGSVLIFRILRLEIGQCLDLR